MKRAALIVLALAVLAAGGAYLAEHRGSGTGDSAATAGSSHAATSSQGTGTGVAPTGAIVPVPDSDSVTLALGETAEYDGFLITPTEVTEDSRCPAGVYCIQAGTVAVTLSAKTPLGTFTRTAKLGDSITLGSKKFTFSSVAPTKMQTPIDPKAYRFTVTIEKV